MLQLFTQLLGCGLQLVQTLAAEVGCKLIKIADVTRSLRNLGIDTRQAVIYILQAFLIPCINLRLAQGFERFLQPLQLLNGSSKVLHSALAGVVERILKRHVAFYALR